MASAFDEGLPHAPHAIWCQRFRPHGSPVQVRTNDLQEESGGSAEKVSQAVQRLRDRAYRSFQGLKGYQILDSAYSSGNTFLSCPFWIWTATGGCASLAPSLPKWIFP